MRAVLRDQRIERCFDAAVKSLLSPAEHAATKQILELWLRR